MSSTATTLVLAPELISVRVARALVRNTGREALLEDSRCGDAEVMASELVTNAILHGRSEARIRVVVLPGPGLRVEVGDDNSRHPTPAGHDDEALDGRGLLIVDALSASWGVRDEALGKTVWFEV